MCAVIRIYNEEEEDDKIYQEPRSCQGNAICNQDCIPFTRSDFKCPSAYEERTQFNALTSFVDLSGVYGSEHVVVNGLR